MRVTPYGDTDAHGKFGTSIVFQRYRGIVSMRKRVDPFNPNSSAQQTQRSAFRQSIIEWRLLSTITRAYYEAKAPAFNMSGLNLFMHFYLLGQLPSSSPLLEDDYTASHISITRANPPLGYRYIHRTIPPSTILGDIYDKQNVFTNLAVAPALEPMQMDVLTQITAPQVQERDTISITGVNVGTILVYMPAITINTQLYLSTDGSTYYDIPLKDLAQASGF